MFVAFCLGSVGNGSRPLSVFPASMGFLFCFVGFCFCFVSMCVCFLVFEVESHCSLSRPGGGGSPHASAFVGQGSQVLDPEPRFQTDTCAYITERETHAYIT